MLTSLLTTEEAELAVWILKNAMNNIQQTNEEKERIRDV